MAKPSPSGRKPWLLSATVGRRVAGVVDQDLLGRDEEARRGAVALDVEAAVGGLELAQVERGQVARRVVQEHVLGARIARVDGVRGLARVPLLDGVLVLRARVAADPRALGDKVEQRRRVDRLDGLARRDGPEVVADALVGGLHEGVVQADRLVDVLEGDRAVGGPVEGAVVALLDERPRLALLLLLGAHELLDVRVPHLERLHDGRAARLAADLMVPPVASCTFMKLTGPEGVPPPESFSCEERSLDQSAPTPRPNLNRRALSPMSFQMSSTESSTEMMKQALRLRALVGVDVLDRLRRLVPAADGLAARVADAVLLAQADVEPDGAVEGAHLVRAEPRRARRRTSRRRRPTRSSAGSCPSPRWCA